MGYQSQIEWCHHTFNPWTGCTKISAACDNCYAEQWANRFNHVEWGPHGARRRTRNWSAPRKWDRALAGTGRRERVFCASLADVFDNHRSIDPAWRHELWALMMQTPNLDWLILTKRPQNILPMIPPYWDQINWPENVWIGATAENQKEALRRCAYLMRLTGPPVRFLSCEPLLGPIKLGRVSFPSITDQGYGQISPLGPGKNQINWIIAGGESGKECRETDDDWYRLLRDDCAAAGIPFLFKQYGGSSRQRIKARGRELDGIVHDGYPDGVL